MGSLYPTLLILAFCKEVGLKTWGEVGLCLTSFNDIALSQLRPFPHQLVIGNLA